MRRIVSPSGSGIIAHSPARLLQRFVVQQADRVFDVHPGSYLAMGTDLPLPWKLGSLRRRRAPALHTRRRGITLFLRGFSESWGGGTAYNLQYCVDEKGIARAVLCVLGIERKGDRAVKKYLWILACAALLSAPASSVVIDWVSVGDAGNACDVQSQGCFGAVAESYQISETEVTNAQYAEFLNAVAATDTYALYNTFTGADGGITRTGSSGSYSYSAIGGRESLPVNFVSFFDTLRFANWLHNGQGAGSTETGAYTLNGSDPLGVTRNGDAMIFLPSEDEWYKAAYFDGASFLGYPAGTDTQTVCAAAGATANTANCLFVVGGVTDVGSYTGSFSPYGTFDQGGNVVEWNETIISASNRGLRGGSWIGNVGDLAASFQVDVNPTIETIDVGFRVASIPEPVPEPGMGLQLSLGALVLAVWRRRCA